MSLTDTACRSAKHQDKPYKRSDERGLYLLVNKVGKYWRFDYRFAGKRKTLALGVYPDVSLAMARERRDAARRRVADGVDPGVHRTLEKIRRSEVATNTFEAVALEFLARFSPSWAPGHTDKIKRRLERDVFPWIGKRPITEIDAPELFRLIRRIEGRGAMETAHRALQNCGRVFRYAVVTGRATSDPSVHLRGALKPVNAKHHASITDPKQLGELLKVIWHYKGSFVTQSALRLSPYLFVRPGELRHAEWTEIDWDRAEWRIPAAKMKMDETHIVPLSRQAVEILRELNPLTCASPYVFPGGRSLKRPMSENAVLAGLRRLGYSKTEMTGHGFRSIASTLLHEQGWPHDAVERQLAHGERNKVSAAYNYAQHLGERRKMMQSWADYLDALRCGKDADPAGTGT